MWLVMVKAAISGGTRCPGVQRCVVRSVRSREAASSARKAIALAVAA